MKYATYLAGLFLLIFGCDNKTSPQTETNISQNTSLDLVAPTDAFIKKYEGKIGDNLSIELVLINWSNGMLGGYYFYKKEGKTPQHISLSGELALNETFVIGEFDDNDFTGKFEGSLSELTTIDGIWSNADSTTTYPFRLEEVPTKDNFGWTKAWYRNEAHSPGMAIIGNVTDKNFDFGLEIFNGGHSGLLEGTAELNGNIATYKHTLFDEDEPCFLIFQKQDNEMRIVQKSSNWACGFGMRAHAEGKYDDHFKNIETQLNYGGPDDIFPTEQSHNKFKELVQGKYEDFAFNMQTITNIPKHESDIFEAKVFIGSVPGLAMSNEGIIMINADHQYWAATIIYDDLTDQFQVHYFTNDPSKKSKIPRTIEEWRAGFVEYEIVM